MVNFLLFISARLFNFFPDRLLNLFLGWPYLRRPAAAALARRCRPGDFNRAGLGGLIKMEIPPRPLTERAGGPEKPWPPYEILYSVPMGFEGHKIALMAHHDPEGLIDPYVIRYLAHLKTLGYALILITCGRKPQLTEELKALLSALVFRSGPGYDFTSWQATFGAWPALFEAEELLLCNDSVFAPIGSYAPVHETMAKVACDFWGLCENKENNSHLQSFYLVFRKKAAASPAFRQFWPSLEVTTRSQAVRAELALTAVLAEKGLLPGAYITAASVPINNFNPAHIFWKPLIKYFAYPCLKRNLLSGDLAWLDTAGWRDIVAEKGYDPALIDNYFKRIRAKEDWRR